MARFNPSMTALLGMLAVAGYQNRHLLRDLLQNRGSDPAPVKPTAQQRTPNAQPDIVDTLREVLAGGSIEGVVASVLDLIRGNGAREEADSWVSTEPNQPITPERLQDTLGDDLIDELVKRTGLTRSEVLSRLGQAIPENVDTATPNGRAPRKAAKSKRKATT